MRQRTQEKLLKSLVFFITLLMIILRFLLNEKGRVTPDSIRFMRQAWLFPEIDNTTAPLLYPLLIKFFGLFSDVFWGSKMLGILSYLVWIFWSWKKKFYWQESLLLGGLFCMISLFSATLSEALFFPILFILYFVLRNILLEKYSRSWGIFLLSSLLILLFNVRYSGVFFMGGVFFYGLINFTKSYAKTYLISGLIAFGFVGGYKIFFIDHFNPSYVNHFLEIGLKPTQTLLLELAIALGTSCNPLIHILNPNGGGINILILGIGFLNLAFMLFVFIKNSLSATEKMMVFVSFFGILCSFFIQYFYQTDALDYRLLMPFTFGIWLIYFKKLFQIFGKWVFSIAFLSLFSGFVFAWLSRGNYLENRRLAENYLHQEQLLNTSYRFYVNEKNSRKDALQIAELLSTINPQITLTYKASDTLEKKVITPYQFEQKVKIKKNAFQ